VGYGVITVAAVYQTNASEKAGADAAAPPMGTLAKAVVLGLAGIVLAAVVAMFFTVKVCDTQLAQNSKPVEVCRHLQVSDPPAALGGLVVIGLLGATVFTEVSAFGVTLKRSVQQLKERQDHIAAEVEQTRDTAARAKEDAEDLYESIASQASPESASRTETGRTATISDLENRYDELRRTMPSGPARTAQMDDVYNAMMLLLRDSKDFDVRAHLSSSRRSERLSAYAFLHASPRPEFAPDLVRALVAEDKPYGEYRGALALARIVDGHPGVLTHELRGQLKQRLRQLPARSDRAHVIRRILGPREVGA
jgi:outer membrane murein-binding lipoprotein Lpp